MAVPLLSWKARLDDLVKACTAVKGGVRIVDQANKATWAWMSDVVGADPTVQELASIAAVITAFSKDDDVAQAAWQTGKDKSSAKTSITSGAQYDRLSRAAATLSVDQFNILRKWDRDLKAAVAASTSFADMKTRIAALANLNDLTLQQVQTAISNNIDNDA